jgi:ribosomal-protein-alanine N-acetyltransferase
MSATEIVTDRLRLRPLEAADLPRLREVVFSDPAVTWDGRAKTEAESEAALEHKLRHVREHGFGVLAVTDRATGELLGYAGLQHLEDGPEVEIGYYLGRRAWGRGLATELALRLVDVAFDELRLPRLMAVVRPHNDASKRVLTKAGLRYSKRAHHYGADVELWELTRDRARSG